MPGMIGWAVWAAMASSGPAVTAASAIAIDFDSGRVLCEKAADVPRYPASTTKILTGLMLLERLRLEDVVAAPPDTELVGGASLYMKPGEELRASDLLAAILLRSANDACHALAVHLEGGEDGFAEAMNERARQIGCRSTHFTNSHGLHDPRHRTTARDLALIAREAMGHEKFRKTVARRRIAIQRPAAPQDALLVSRNKYLALDPTADGIKTGWTVPAGKCYVGSATRNGFRVITVVLKSEDWIADHRALLDWSFSHYERRPVLKKGELMGQVAVRGGKSDRVGALVARDLWALVRRGEPLSFGGMPSEARAPLDRGQPLGRVAVYQSGDKLGETALTAAHEVGVARSWWPWALAAAGTSVAMLGRRKRPRRRR